MENCKATNTKAFGCTQLLKPTGRSSNCQWEAKWRKALPTDSAACALPTGTAGVCSFDIPSLEYLVRHADGQCGYCGHILITRIPASDRFSWYLLSALLSFARCCVLVRLGASCFSMFSRQPLIPFFLRLKGSFERHFKSGCLENRILGIIVKLNLLLHA